MANPSVVVDFVANTTKLVAGVKQLSGATDEAGNAVKKVDWKRIALWGGAAAGLAAATKFVKDATSSTEDLAKSTIALQRVTGMDTTTASQWVEVLKSRNIETDTFNRSMVLLSKQMEAARGGSAKSVAAFKALGVGMDAVKRGDVSSVLMQMSDGFERMAPGAQRNALTQQLLGRSSAKLTPLLYSGSKAIQDQLNMAHKYGAELGGNTTESVKQLAADQREMTIAMDGLKVKVGTAVIPIIAQLSAVLIDLTRVFQPIIRNSTLLKITLATLAAAFLAWKIVALAATVVDYGLATSLTAALWPIALVVAAIVALIAVGVLLYKNWGTLTAVASKTWAAIKAGASAVLSWLKTNWPLILGILTGPLGLAVVMVVRNWGKIKDATAAAWGWIRDKVAGVLASLRGAVSSFTAWMSGAWAAVRTQLDRVASWFEKPLDAARAMANGVKAAIQAIPAALAAVVGAVSRDAGRVANAIRGPVNAVIGAWNGLALTFPKVSIPSVSIPHVGKIGGQSFGGWRFPFPQIPKLAKGGVFTSPTLALVGEGGGREIVTPEALLRQIVGQMVPTVHVYIGDTELRDLVRVEAVAVDNATARAILGGLA